MVILILFETNHTPSGEKTVYNFEISTCTSKHVQKPEYTSLDDEDTQCSWQTLWLHTEYRVYTSHVTVYAELVSPLLSSLILFPFHLGCNFDFTDDSYTVKTYTSSLSLLL